MSRDIRTVKDDISPNQCSQASVRACCYRSEPSKDLAEIGLFCCIPIAQRRIPRLFAALRILAPRYGMKKQPHSGKV